MKCLVSAAKRLIIFLNNVPPSLNPKLNLTDSGKQQIKIKIAAKYCDQDGRQIEIKDLKGIRLNMAVASTPSTFLYTLLLIVMQAGELQQQEIS